MIALETLNQIDEVASRHGLHSGEVRILLSAELPSWITPTGQEPAQALLAHWLEQGIDAEILKRDLPLLQKPLINPLSNPSPAPMRLAPTPAPSPTVKRNLVQLLADRFHRPAR